MRARYGRGPWSAIKWLLDPFAAVGIYLILVSFVLDRPGSAPGLSLACAVVPFQLVMMTIANALSSLETRRSIILNMAFPRNLIPASSAGTESVAFAASFSLIVMTMAAYGIGPTEALLWLPLVLAMNFALAVAAAYPAALLTIWVPDLRRFVASFVRTLFFVSPGLVALNQIPATTQDVIRLNPLTGLFEAYRAVFLYGTAPEAWHFAIPLAAAALLVAVFVPIFRREQRHLAKVVMD